jgi:hypothetical protein
MITSLLLALVARAPHSVSVSFFGGFDTDPRDRGRPVVLIAAGLGVPSTVFREAFSHVHPAPARSQPDPQEVRQNKDALLSALGKYGVTNERLDFVSNYYRYDRSRGEWWPYTLATATATVENGKVTGFVITNGGSGYSSSPAVSVPGFGDVKVVATVLYGKDLKRNGIVTALSVAR